MTEEAAKQRREQFEKWAARFDVSLPLNKDANGRYVRNSTAMSEMAFEAGREQGIAEILAELSRRGFEGLADELRGRALAGKGRS